ncbi:MAG: exopolyphosphatase [Deltaproteobacteria bacterium HGW-Deltaproteobacteria-15]|jgi:nanoRNase/pAp phosphatase (c-di-AMP/oligoRNAs hydrolase)|nr:MAG: exopolyphosphatase [Deltaproteobacteria bacterium HGW-Deltaproteobacteria-15]
MAPGTTVKQEKPILMDHPFPKSTSSIEKCKRLFETVSPEDTLAILINADPDAIASALALTRLLWRRIKRTLVFHVNIIKRADNLAMIKLLKIQQQHIRKLNPAEITRWALVDSQPSHHELLSKYKYDIIIDHHPFVSSTSAQFLDVKEDYGANSTIMTEYLRATKVKPSPRLATALFYGIKTDTDNFVRPSIQSDINAFRYLYPFANLNLIKKIESSEMTRQTLAGFRAAMENLTFLKDKAFIHMGRVNDPDILVIIADFFLKMVEATWCIVSGVYGQKLIVIFRNAGFRLNAGSTAQSLFGQWGSAGGHTSTARAEIPLQEIESDVKESDLREWILEKLKTI